MSEKMKLLITEITEKPWEKDGKTVTFYNCKTASGLEVSTTDAEVKQYKGQEHEFSVTVSEKNGQKKYYLNFQKPGFQKNFGGGGKSYGKSRDELVLSTKTMVLSYCKDLALGQNEPSKMDFAKLLENVKTGFKELLPLMDLDKLPESSKIEPSASTGHSQAPLHPPLKPALVAILKQKFKGWTNIDIVKYVGSVGFEMPHDKVSGDIYFDRLIEEEANIIINELEKQ